MASTPSPVPSPAPKEVSKTEEKSGYSIPSWVTTLAGLVSPGIFGVARAPELPQKVAEQYGAAKAAMGSGGVAGAALDDKAIEAAWDRFDKINPIEPPTRKPLQTRDSLYEPTPIQWEGNLLPAKALTTDPKK